MDVKWGKAPEMTVRSDPHGRTNLLQVVGNMKEAPMGVLHWPEVWMMPMTKDQAKKLGAALIRVSNA